MYYCHKCHENVSSDDVIYDEKRDVDCCPKCKKALSDYRDEEGGEE